MPRISLADLKRLKRPEPIVFHDGSVEVGGEWWPADLIPPETEFRFHPERKWRFDFAWPEQKVAVEVDGGVFSGGRHTRGMGFIRDCEKLNMACEMGWKVLRYQPGKLDYQQVRRVLYGNQEEG